MGKTVKAVQAEAVQAEAVQAEAVQAKFDYASITSREGLIDALKNATDKAAFMLGYDDYHQQRAKAEAEAAKAEAEVKALADKYFPVQDTTTVPTIASYTKAFAEQAGIIHDGKVVKMRLAAFLYYDGHKTTAAGIAALSNDLVKAWDMAWPKGNDAKGSDYGNLIRDCKTGNCHQYYHDFRAVNPV